MSNDVVQWRVDESLPQSLSDFLGSLLELYKHPPQLATAVVAPFDQAAVDRWLQGHANTWSGRVCYQTWKLLLEDWPQGRRPQSG